MTRLPGVLCALACGSLALVAGVAGVARADFGPPVELAVIPPAGDAPPQVAATFYEPLAPAATLQLIAEGGVAVPATSVRPYAGGDEPAAIVLVFNGQEIWTGNEDVEPDAVAARAGILKSLALAVDDLHFDRVLPAGSVGAVVTYSTGAQLRVPMGPIGRLTGAALGTQRDYYHLIGFDLFTGVMLGLAELEHAPVARKLLIVVGDGTDSDDETTAPVFAALRHTTAAAHIEIAAIRYRCEVSSSGTVIDRLAIGATDVCSVEGLRTALANAVARLTPKYEVRFSGASLKNDGKLHWVGVRAGDVHLGFADLVLPRWAPAPAPVGSSYQTTARPAAWWRSSWLPQLGAGALLAALCVLGLRVRAWFARGG